MTHVERIESDLPGVLCDSAFLLAETEGLMITECRPVPGISCMSISFYCFDLAGIDLFIRQILKPAEF